MIYCKFFFFQYMYYNVLSLATLIIHSDTCHYHPLPFLKDADLRKSRMCPFCVPILNPFASIGCTGTYKGKVKVRDICLNIAFLT